MAGEVLKQPKGLIDKDPNRKDINKKLIAGVAGLAVTVAIGLGIGDRISGNNKAEVEATADKTEVAQPLTEKEQLAQDLENFGPEMEAKISQADAKKFSTYPTQMRLQIADYIQKKVDYSGIYKSTYGTDIQYNDVTAESDGQDIANAIQEKARIPFLTHTFKDNQILLNKDEALMCLSSEYYVDPENFEAPTMYANDRDKLETLSNAMEIATIIKYESESGPLNFVNEDGDVAKINIIKIDTGGKGGEFYDAVIDVKFTDYTGKSASKMLLIARDRTYEEAVQNISEYGYNLEK